MFFVWAGCEDLLFVEVWVVAVQVDTAAHCVLALLDPGRDHILYEAVDSQGGDG